MFHWNQFSVLFIWDPADGPAYYRWKNTFLGSGNKKQKLQQFSKRVSVLQKVSTAKKAKTIGLQGELR